MTILDKHTSEVLTASFSANAQMLLTTSSDGSVKIWDLNGNVLMNQQLAKNVAPFARFSLDGQQVITFGNENHALLCATPNIAYQQLKQTPPPPFTAQQKEQFGIRE